ncbi:DUF1515 family protein [Bradyrhizobium sp. WSM4349]|uniref:DUF1515 family protein n=1 Tax=Bradyrhizobium sp. WSM4349 TaxID=1040988 RepID=UPI00036C4A9A|nr:DUF1515 family protein [Bradyrhizobium sp. WSM4349]
MSDGAQDAATQAALLTMAKSLGGLESTVAGLVSQWRSQDEKASQGRRDLHQKIDAMRTEMQELDGLLKGAIKDIADMKPTVEAVENAKQQAVGASKASVWLWRLAIFISGGAAWVIANYLKVGVTLK